MQVVQRPLVLMLAGLGAAPGPPSGSLREDRCHPVDAVPAAAQAPITAQSRSGNVAKDRSVEPSTIPATSSGAAW